MKKSASSFSLGKRHSITSRDTILALSKSKQKVWKYPIVFRFLTQESETETTFLFVVPKRRLKRAVDRNAVKRKMREAVRQCKPLWENNKTQAIGLYYSSNEMLSQQRIQNIVSSFFLEISSVSHDSEGSDTALEN